jgi:hypothetical protein
MRSTAKLAILGIGAAVASAGLVYWARRRAPEAPERGAEPSPDTLEALDELDFGDHAGVAPEQARFDEVGDYVEVDVILDDIGELYGVRSPQPADGAPEAFGDGWIDDTDR